MKFAQLPGLLDKVFPKRLILPFVVKELSKVVVVSSAKDHPELEGQSLYEIARARKKDIFEVILDLLVESELAVAAIAHVMSEDDVRTVLSHPTTMVGTDGFPQKEGKPHPRTYGTHPRVLEHYVRSEKLLSLERAVHKMTGQIAQKFHLEGRGVLQPGAAADLVVFDPDRIHDRATYADPKNGPEGIRLVVVNGVVTAEDGKHTGATAGRALSRAA
jgi:N-acyl-D-aspartate/D-glutamate deacylase